MRTIFPRVVLCAALSLTSATAFAQTDEETGNVAKGQAYAQSHCGTCHATGAAGKSPYAPAPPFRTLHERYDVEGLAEALAEGISVGHTGTRQMPEFMLTPGEIDDFLAYLKSFEK